MYCFNVCGNDPCMFGSWVSEREHESITSWCVEQFGQPDDHVWYIQQLGGFDEHGYVFWAFFKQADAGYFKLRWL